LKHKAYILFLLLLLFHAQWCAGDVNKNISFDFYGDTIEFPRNASTQVVFEDTLSHQAISSFYERMLGTEYQPVIDALLAYKQKHTPDDWVYYQLIRKTAQAICPKAENYYRYTLYKSFLLNKSGFEVALDIVGTKLLFFVQSNEDIYDVPFFKRDGKQYVCLNYHDYGFKIDFEPDKHYYFPASGPGVKYSFSYKLTQLPEFRQDDYHEKDLEFAYRNVDYRFKVKLNHAVKDIFTNYPVADYGLYFNVPLSKETYNTLIPQLKKNVKGLSLKNGVDYLMHFTRYAFPYEPDKQNFGREKRLSPEQTLLYDRSDCEDRAALFYCLVKEIYNLPMIVLAFPQHVAIGVNLGKPFGRQIEYNSAAYSVCEPTPQAGDLPVGALSANLKSVAYEVAYSYIPSGQ